MKMVISLCDYSGVWANAFKPYGYTTMLIDPKHDKFSYNDHTFKVNMTVVEYLDTLRANKADKSYRFDDLIILAAPPCTDFSLSGAQYWPAKDADGRTGTSLALVDDCLKVIDLLNPRVWALENPVGRLPALRRGTLGPWRMKFHPYEYTESDDDRYPKATCLWGQFKEPKKNPTEPLPDSKIMKVGGDRVKTKELRSITPTGFANAFAKANRKITRKRIQP